MKIKAVLFDVDGTLISLDYIIEGINKTAEKLGLKKLTKKEIYSNIVGYHLEDKLKKIYPELTPEKIKEFRKTYHEIYKEINVKPFPNALKTIKEIKKMKIKIGIVTTKSKTTAKEALEEIKVNYGVLITNDDVNKIKPSPEPIIKACEQLKVKPSETIMVGDHNFDMQSAKKAGAIAIAIDSGAKTEQELLKEKPNYLIHDLIEVIKIIKKINNEKIKKQDNEKTEEQELEETYDIINIPKDRVAVLIGKKGEIKKKIQKETSTKIEINSDGEVIIKRKITTENPLKQLKARDIIKAIARGFSPEKAFLLLKQENYLEVINLSEYVSDKSLKRIRSRIIGKEGKSRKIISKLTKTEIVIYGKTVSIIGKIQNIQITKKSIMKIIEGAPHSAVFRYLERNKTTII